MSYRIQRNLLVIAFLFLPMILMALFLIYPTIRMVFFSFTNWDGVLPTYKFVGIRNFTRVLTEPQVWLSLKNNGVYIISGIVQNIIALFFAVLLTSRIRMKTFYKLTIFLPYVLNITAVAYMFSYFYDYREGPINMLLKSLSWHPIKFFSNEHLVIFSLAFISMWRWLGYTMILYIAALLSVDREIYDSSKVDGASKWQTFWHISFPNIQKIVELCLFLTISGGLQAFAEPLIMTKGGPNHASYTFLYYIIDSSTVFNDYGYAAAMACVLVVIILILTLIQRKFLFRSEN